MKDTFNVTLPTIRRVILSGNVVAWGLKFVSQEKPTIMSKIM
jgi:hypothetical protein